jgi:hypothetical protein
MVIDRLRVETINVLCAAVQVDLSPFLTPRALDSSNGGHVRDSSAKAYRIHIHIYIRVGWWCRGQIRLYATIFMTRTKGNGDVNVSLYIYARMESHRPRYYRSIFIALETNNIYISREPILVWLSCVFFHSYIDGVMDRSRSSNGWRAKQKRQPPRIARTRTPRVLIVAQVTSSLLRLPLKATFPLRFKWF